MTATLDAALKANADAIAAETTARVAGISARQDQGGDACGADTAQMGY